MRKWLRSRFAWRFSLTRLVVAVVFLGAVVGLNMREVGPTTGGVPDLRAAIPLPARYWGWPFPFAREWDRYELHMDALTGGAYRPSVEESKALMDEAERYRLPLTHQTYQMLWHTPLRWQDPSVQRIAYAILDALFALVVLALILFFHPRRKPPEPEGAK